MMQFICLKQLRGVTIETPMVIAMVYLCIQMVVLVLPNIKRQKEVKDFFDEEGVKVFISKNCWNKYLSHEFVTCLTCLTVFKILLKNEITARLIIFKLTVRKTC